MSESITGAVPGASALGTGIARSPESRALWLGERLLPLCVIGGLLATYQLLGWARMTDARFLPSLADITIRGWQLLASPPFWNSVRSTWGAATWGFVLGLIVAIPLGIAAGRSQMLFHMLRPAVEFLRPLPSVAMIPLVVLIWGPSLTSKAFLAFFTTLWPVFLQTAHGVRDTHPTAIETARSFGFNEWQIVRNIIVPSSLATIATSIRIQASIALLVTITAEAALGGGGGLGLLVFQFDQTGDYAAMYALLVFIGAQGMVLGTVLAWLERALMPWHASHRKSEQ